MFMDLYTREGYIEDDTFDWTTVHTAKSGKLTPNAAARLAKVSGAKHEPPAAKPNAEVKVKVTLEEGVVKLVQRVDLFMKPREERQATQAKNEASRQLGPVKSGLAAKGELVANAKVVLRQMKPTANEPEAKTRPKVLNRIAITTKPTPALAERNAKPLVVMPAPMKSPSRPVAKVEPKAKHAPKPNLGKIERIPVHKSPTPSTPSPRLDVDEVLEKMGDLKISDKQSSAQTDTKVANPRHVYGGNRKVQAQKSTPHPPLPARPTAFKQQGHKKAALERQPANPLPVEKGSLSAEITETSSGSNVAKPSAIPIRRIPLRTCNVNSRPVAALTPSSPQRRRNPPRFANVNANAKSPPRRRAMVTRAAAGRKAG